MAAYGVLIAIQKILEAPLQVDIYRKVFVVVEPIMSFCFSNMGLDYIEESSPLLELLVHTIYPLEDMHWFYYPCLCYIMAGNPTGKDPSVAVQGLNMSEKQKEYIEQALLGWGLEFLNHLVGVMCCYIQQGKDRFFTMKDFFGMTFADLTIWTLNEILKV